MPVQRPSSGLFIAKPANSPRHSPASKPIHCIPSVSYTHLHRIHTLGIGQIRFGVSTTLCKYILVPYLKDFIPMNPHIRINILSQSTMKTLDLLEQRQIDIGLVAEPKNLNDLEFFPVTEIEDGFVASKNYLENLRLREHTDVMDAGLLEIGNIMLLDRQNITRKFIEAYFSEHHIEPAQVLEVTSMDLLIEFARIGLGIGCVIKDLSLIHI